MNKKRILRDIKTNTLLTNDLNISQEKVNSVENLLDITISNVPNNDYVITGSMVLYIYGLLQRKPKDIDIVANDEDFLGELDKRNDYLDEMVFGHEGYKEVGKNKKYKIDLFYINDLKNVPFTTLKYKNNILKINNLFNIIEAKIELSEKNNKHKKDIKKILAL